MDAKQLQNFLKKCYILINGQACTGKKLLSKLYVPYGQTMIPFDEWYTKQREKN